MYATVKDGKKCFCFVLFFTLSERILSRMTSALRTSPLVLSSASTVALALDPLVELTALIT